MIDTNIATTTTTTTTTTTAATDFGSVAAAMREIPATEEEANF